MTDFQIAPYCSERFEGVKSLWQEAFPDDPPWNAAEIAIPAKLAVQPDLFFVALDGDQVVRSIMAGYDGHRGWLYALAVLNSHRRRGVGAALVRARRTVFDRRGATRSTYRSDPQTPPSSNSRGGSGM
jgi:GNAT superfamily N-acetyltransferase